MLASIFLQTMVFEEEEKVVLNNFAVDKDRKTAIKNIKLGMALFGGGEMTSFYSGLMKKVDLMSDDEWNDLQGLLPFVLTIPDSEEGRI